MGSIAYISLILIVLILILFFIAGNNENWENLNASSFECGYTSYFFSRFSFSIHYLIISLIFLFFDLELCFLIPFLNESTSNLIILTFLSAFVIILLCGLFVEWSSNKLEWVD